MFAQSCTQQMYIYIYYTYIQGCFFSRLSRQELEECKHMQTIAIMQNIKNRRRAKEKLT